MARNHKPEAIIGKLREAGIVPAQGGTVADMCRHHLLASFLIFLYQLRAHRSLNRALDAFWRLMTRM